MQSITATSPTNKSGSLRPLWLPPISRLQLQAEKARRDLSEFVAQAWPVLEPATRFVKGLHVEAICRHLQAVAERADWELDY